MRWFKISVALNSAVIGGLTALLWPVLSWQFFAVVIPWAVLNGLAQTVDNMRGVNQ